MRVLAVPLALAVFVMAGCSRTSDRDATPLLNPTAPTVGPPRPPAPIESTTWTLITTLLSVSGPENCLSRGFRDSLGRETTWTMLMERTGTTLRLLYDLDNFPTDHTEYAGTVEGTRFEGVTEISAQATFHPCDGNPLRGTLTARVNGAFMEDDSRLTGVEEWTYALTTGDVVVRYNWAASRR